MANKYRGEHQFELEGQVYVLRFRAGEIAAAETELGISMHEINSRFADPNKLSMTFLRAMLCAGLVGVDSLEARRAIFDQMLPLEVAEHVGKAWQLAWDDDARKGADRPTMTGPSDLSTGSSSMQHGSVAASTRPNSGTTRPSKSAASV